MIYPTQARAGPGAVQDDPRRLAGYEKAPDWSQALSTIAYKTRLLVHARQAAAAARRRSWLVFLLLDDHALRGQQETRH